MGQEYEDDDLDIEVEDDTPEEDRGRTPMPGHITKALDDDELGDYDEAVKQKMVQLKKVWHDERREKEAALREHQEAVGLARHLLAENQQLKGTYASGEKEYIHMAKESAHYQLEAAKQAYREAYESGDTEAIVTAQENLNLAQLNRVRAAGLRETALQMDESVVQRVQQHSQPKVPKVQPDTKALQWQQENPWFGDDHEMTSTALGVHTRLVKQGVEVGSDDYYRALDTTMRKRFSDYFGDQDTRPQSKGRPTTVVAPATRSTSAKSVKLRESQLQLAKRLGLTPQQYAKEMIRLENSNGR